MSTPPPLSPYHLELESIDISIDVYSIYARLTSSFCRATVCSSVVIMMFGQVPDFHLLATKL